MSTFNVNELNDLVMASYRGNTTRINVEDLKYIKNKLSIVNPTKSVSYVTYVHLNDILMLAVDETYPINQLILSSYTVALATPPLVSYEFDLAFKLKSSVSSPSLKLSEVLLAVGYNGPRISNLSQLYMQLVQFESPETTFAEFRWLSSDDFNVPSTWVDLPLTQISLTTTYDVKLEFGYIKMKRAGIYQVTGAWTRKMNNVIASYFTGFSLNDSDPSAHTQVINYNPPYTLSGSTGTVAVPGQSNNFTFIVNITDADINANDDSHAWLKIKIKCGEPTVFPLYRSDLVNWVAITKVA
jgi:hypothetical protein